MSRFLPLLLLFLLPAASSAQLVDRTPPPPQTPRQALMEVLKSRDSNALQRHLPELTRKKLREFAGDNALASMMPGLGIAGLMGHGSGQTMEVFEAGPILALLEHPRRQEKIEIVIEAEDFRGDENDFELGIRTYKEGKEYLHWYAPRILLRMQEEEGVWRFAEVGFSAKLPLSDPDFLDMVGKEFRETREQVVVGNMRSLLTAQIQYASNYPESGYACSLETLGGKRGRLGERQPNEKFAMLIDDTLASGRRDGYTYAITHCTGRPVASFAVTAVPDAPGSGRAFCANESGVIRYAADGRAETCLASGKLLQ
jgi:hypothetical protein